MDYNPFVAELRAVNDEIQQLEERRGGLVEQIGWATRFDPEEHVGEIALLRSDLEDCAAELERRKVESAELGAKSRQLGSQTPGIERDARLGLKVYRFFTSEYDQAVSRLKEHKRELDRVRSRAKAADEQRGQVACKLAELADHVMEKEQALLRFDAFRPDEANKAIAKVDVELAILQQKRDQVESRASDVDRAIEVPLAELQKYESELNDHKSTVSQVKSRLSRLERQIADAKDIDERLSRASTGSEKYELHQECEREFDVGSPRAAMGAIRSKMRPLQDSIADQERQITRIRRDMAKTEQRIVKLAAVAARDIDALVIDGNNCCYQGRDFIGLAALIPVTANLAERFAVTVVFDATIRRRFRVSDDDLREALPATKVHVVASRAKADETILDAADEPTVWVVSNDRYGEYREKRAVEEERLIRHEIVSGRIFVHDLRVNEPILAV